MPIREDLLTTKEAAEILGKPVATVNRWALEGRLRVAAQLPGRTGARLYSRTDVERALPETAA